MSETETTSLVQPRQLPTEECILCIVSLSLSRPQGLDLVPRTERYERYLHANVRGDTRARRNALSPVLL